MNAYCTFCKTTREEKTAKSINQIYGMVGVKAIAPVRVLKERRRGIVKEIRKSLIAGYVFIFSDFQFEPRRLQSVQNVIKMLSYHTGKYELTGDDLAYANFIYGNNGVIGVSDVLCEGREVKVLSGPLLDYKGFIVRLDKRKERVYLRICLDGIEREVSLSVNILAEV